MRIGFSTLETVRRDEHSSYEVRGSKPTPEVFEGDVLHVSGAAARSAVCVTMSDSSTQVERRDLLA